MAIQFRAVSMGDEAVHMQLRSGTPTTWPGRPQCKGQAPAARAPTRALAAGYWLPGWDASAAPLEKFTLRCAAVATASKYFCSSPMVIDGLHCGVQL